MTTAHYTSILVFHAQWASEMGNIVAHARIIIGLAEKQYMTYEEYSKACKGQGICGARNEFYHNYMAVAHKVQPAEEPIPYYLLDGE